ncbi:uncharacterized protein LOC124166970 isoform X2 [Ischnura elegans]|uniref:uncharacterized protein LOC124166970 isoform X2 n=1 Tax=Ischnura elegans TaxID=197161 RepID=UPI001ED8AD67|nr:uncharacterized protein LOC124166970 isoform X2 [Ischnura elegans]
MASRVYHRLFHQNMLALTAMNPDLLTSHLKNILKEGMFLRPNYAGFFQVTYFLMQIIYPGSNAFRTCFPPLEKTQEREFRRVLIELIRGLNEGFGDLVTISEIIPGSIMTPGGNKFIKLVWELSLLAIAVQGKRVDNDVDICMPVIPPRTTPKSLKEKATDLWKMNAKSKLKSCKAILDELDACLASFEMEKKKNRNRMLLREKKINEIVADYEKMIRESTLSEDEKSRTRLFQIDSVDPSRDASEIQKWNNIASLCVNTKEVLEASINFGNASHLVANVCTRDEASALSANWNDDSGYSSGVSLLGHLSGIHTKLKALNPLLENSCENRVCSFYQSMAEEKREIISLVTELESKLEEEMGVVSSFISNSEENASGCDSLTTLSWARKQLATSTPISKDRQASERCGLHKMTPYQPAANDNYFVVKVDEELKRLLEEEGKRLVEATRNNPMNTSFELLQERFRKFLAERSKPAERRN